MSLAITGKLVLAFVTLLLGAVLIGSLSTNILGNTDKTVIADEAIDLSSSWTPVDGSINVSSGTNNLTVTNNPTSWKVNDCPLTSVVYGNSSEDYTLDTDYTLTASSGLINVLNTTVTVEGGNATLIDYTYCANDYLNISWGRTVLNLVSGFFALAILLMSIGLFFSVAKDTGMI